ncbi:MAG: type VI secretion system baseplate subunit TssE [Acidobacteriota bacterium]|nr:type VI secretion system baseplate subunit TssE [Acidobacteriota bacterium]
MATRETERAVQQSLLDRLVDREPAAAVDDTRRWGRAKSVQESKRAMRRDLEWLLNTRRIVEPADEAFEELQASLYHYGLPDISSLSADSVDARRSLLRQIEETIERFEPRMTGVRVSILEASDFSARQVRFLIEGLLRLDPEPEPVVFDTILETSSGKFQIGGDGNA